MTQSDWKFDSKKYEGHTPGKRTVRKSWDGDGYEVVTNIDKRNGSYTPVAEHISRKVDAYLIADAPDLLAEVVKEKAENQRLREALQAARRAMNYEWVKYYEMDRPAPASLKEAVNYAVRVLGEEGGEA